MPLLRPKLYQRAVFFACCYTSCLTLSAQAFELGFAAGKTALVNPEIELTRAGETWQIDNPQSEHRAAISLKLGNWVKHQERWGWAAELNTMPQELEFSLPSDDNSTLKLKYYQAMFNTYYRWFPRVGSLNFEPFIGAGIGFVLTEFELKQAAQSRTEKIAYTGLSGQVLTGVRVELVQDLSLSLEYKFSYLPSDADLDEGVTLALSPWVNVLQLGLYYQF